MIAQRCRVVFAHGKESGPWGIKIRALADVARARGCVVDSPDYQGIDDPALRLARLVDLAPSGDPLVLVGSSMGGWVSAMACAALKPDALMLMAPALYFPGWDDEPAGIPKLCAVAHSWRDDIVPVERAIRFATRHQAELHVYDADHSLVSVLPRLEQLLDGLLERALSEGRTRSER